MIVFAIRILIQMGPDPNTWNDLVRLFTSMNKGGKFGSHEVNQFNGGLFADDPEFESIKVPNRLFCIQEQGIKLWQVQQCSCWRADMR